MYIRLHTLFVILAVVFLSAPTGQAQTDTTATTTEDVVTAEDVTEIELPEAGTLPDSPFYFLKRLREGVGNVFAFTATQKARRYQELADKRLAEARALAEEGKEELAARTVERYGERMGSAIERAEEAQEQGQNVDEVLARISERSIRHQEVLGRVLERVPEQAKDAIQGAIENSTRNYERTIDRIEDTDARTQVLHRLAPNIERTGERLQELQAKGVPVSEEAVRKVEEIRQQVQGDPALRSRLLEAREVRDRICAQIITKARNLITGEIQEFPTPCDVPYGWKRVEDSQEPGARNGQRNTDSATSTTVNPLPPQKPRRLEQ